MIDSDITSTVQFTLNNTDNFYIGHQQRSVSSRINRFTADVYAAKQLGFDGTKSYFINVTAMDEGGLASTVIIKVFFTDLLCKNNWNEDSYI